MKTCSQVSAQAKSMFKLLQMQRYVTMLGFAIIFYSYIQFDWVDRWSDRVKRRVHTSKLLIAQQLRKFPSFDPDFRDSLGMFDDNMTFESHQYVDEIEDYDETMYDGTQYDVHYELKQLLSNMSQQLPRDPEKDVVKQRPGKQQVSRRYQILKMKRSANVTFNYTEKPLMVLFSSWVYSREKSDVHSIVLHLWNYWQSIRPLLVTSDPVAKRLAMKANWHTLPVTKVHKDCKGPPVLLDMFVNIMRHHEAYFYGYSNSDILFGSGLAETLRFIQRIEAWQNKPLLIVGRRNNVDFKRHKNATLNTPANVTDLRVHGKLVVRSTDYFFSNVHFPWRRVPEVSIGRPFVVRAIIGWAIKHKITIVDVTRTVPAIHLTTKDGVFASWHKAGAMCNEKVLMKLHWTVPTNIGHCECATLETIIDDYGKMQVRRRSPAKRFCSKGA